jgi:hypothetical protein
MPTIEKNIEIREKQTLERFENVVIASEVLKKFYAKGFKSVQALHAIIYSYYPETSYADVLNFWHFRKCSSEIIERFNNVFERLNYE